MCVYTAHAAEGMRMRMRDTLIAQGHIHT
jgi:hypothetical protein